MKNFIGKITAALAMAVLAVVSFGAAPVSASTVYNCPDDQVCLFDGTNYGTYSWWHNSFTAINGSDEPGASPAGCVNLSDDGTFAWGYMNNAASSIIVNASSDYAQNTWKVKFWMNGNCTGTPVPYVRVASGLSLDPNLTDGGFGSSINWSNAVTSISVSVG